MKWEVKGAAKESRAGRKGAKKQQSIFTLPPKRKVDVQWRLFALVHNIDKIHSFGALC
jgi:hypothetical protein